MPPITHFIGSWLLAAAVTDNPRDRKLVTLAGVLPDLDGLGIVAEVIGPMLSREELQSRIAEFFQPPYNEQEAELVNLMEVAKNRGPLGPAFDPEDPESDD